MTVDSQVSFQQDWQAFEQGHVWHPYAPMPALLPPLPVASAQGVKLILEDGRELIDGMSSWWAAIHGYNHPILNAAVQDQLGKMSHVMFGGLTHRPAAELAALLIDLTPEPLDQVFLSDSGSVAVEAAIKMALQYWQVKGAVEKCSLLTVRGGYHGDTFGAMAVCDPVTGMHSLFSNVLPKHYFAPVPECPLSGEWDDAYIAEFRSLLQANHKQIAAVILEPIVQGAGGMRFYGPEYLRQVRTLCDKYDVLLIFDEIATGFGRTGTLFATDRAGIAPDIMCLGKALTGGYMTLAATLTTRKISSQISNHGGAFMHGPTFMANPLACAVAVASIKLLLESPWQARVKEIEAHFQQGLESCRGLPGIHGVRSLGAIGVIEFKKPLDMNWVQQRLVEKGVWLRPFGKLLYAMPPFIIGDGELGRIVSVMVEVAAEESAR
ncbi:Adenosylmethionine-8-amino-7-oxononanoate aminotransferase [hydrothermal vent metagenome]|uniref:Adenosylmethionine-8-amino-7-oxononanoate aminotransferase n=1 Tax=hydrothermal vent metagenome TaxID=652676 RepID=A0A3B1BML5_9ZZZZ